MSDRSMNILMLIDQFYPVLGGAEQQALRISIRLIEKGHRVAVLTRKSREGLADDEILKGIRIHRLPIGGVSGIDKLKSIIPAVRWLIKNSDQYDIIHCHGVNPVEWSAMLAGLKTKKSYLVKIPLSNFLNYAGAKDGFRMDSARRGLVPRVIRRFSLPALQFMRRRMIRNARRVLAISPEICTALEAGGYGNVVNIPNGIDTEEFRPVSAHEKKSLRQKLNLPQDTVLFIYSGRLAIEKNVQTLLYGWKSFLLMPDVPPSHLLILGDGKGQNYSTEEYLRKSAADEELTSIDFKGTVSNVREYLQAADVFILTSFWEGLSNSLLEAMACALPSIVSDIPGNQSLITNDVSGLLFNPHDHEALADRLRRLVFSREKRESMGHRAREIVKSRYSLADITEDIIREYQNILADNIKV
jgi:glycosyltransferase involved in cell wall biosynthesis